jgi:general secretion pathway protein D
LVSTELDVSSEVGRRLINGDANPEPMDVRDRFGSVEFPAGTLAQYNPGFNVLFVRHTPDGIDHIRRILEWFNRKVREERSYQIEIETRFIEVAEGALEELGFDWTVGTPGTLINNDTWALPGGQKLFTDTLRSGEEAFGRTLSTGGRPDAFNAYTSPTADPVGDGLISTPGELLIRRVKDDLPINVILRALERQAGADLLSAPKVLTKSGETAVIHVGEIHWFPTAYDVEVERYAEPSLIPLDYQEEKTGVMLEVTPILDTETATIDLKLSPEIRELAGFDEQHVTTLWPLSSGDDQAFELSGSMNDSLIGDLFSGAEVFTGDRLIARRPVFKSRKVDTSVTIQDGSTIAMGGLIKEQLETFRDSVPVLGSIPFLGRLFRSEGERTVKRNLLIFVTAGRVDASGHKPASE